MLDVDGQTTLHAAVKSNYPQITSILLAAADPKGLQMENSVGNTLLDMVSLGELGSRIQRFPHSQMNTLTELKLAGGVESFYRYPGSYIQKLQKELLKIHAILDVLFADGRLKSQTKLATELTKFASMMKERLSAAEAAHARFPKEEETPVRMAAGHLSRFPEASADKNPKDAFDLEKTSSIVFGALKGSSTVNRQLIHLIDVQKSVGADLEKVVNRSSDRNRMQKYNLKGELDAEQEEEEEGGEEKAQSMVWPYIVHIDADSIC